MRILVVGAGAVGGYFGARLLQAGRDVTFLVRPKRSEQLRALGLRLASRHGDATLRPQLVGAGAIGAPYDAVLLAVKAYGLQRALEDFAPAVGPRTIIVPFLNGMRHLDLLDARYGAAAVLGGVCFVSAAVDAEGRIVQMADAQTLIYGERCGPVTPRAEALHAALGGAGFETRLSSDIMQEMWEKWIFLAALGGICCLLRGTVGEIEAVPGGTALALQLLDECSAVAAASGHAPGVACLARARAMLSTKGSGQSSSMYRDLVQKGLVEADQILGDMLARGCRLGVPTPLLATAFAHLEVYQNQNRQAASGASA